MLDHMTYPSRQMKGLKKGGGSYSGSMGMDYGKGKMTSYSHSSKQSPEMTSYDKPGYGGKAPKPKKRGTRRETGMTYPTLEPNTEFSDPGPDVLGEGRMPEEHTSSDH